MFFDNGAVEEFLRWPEIELTAAQRTATQQLIDKMKEFDALGGFELPPKEILSHSVWHDVQRCGSQLADLLYPDGPPPDKESGSIESSGR